VEAPSIFPAFGTAKARRLRLSFATAPTTGDVIVAQRIEGGDTLAGKDATVSFWQASSEVMTGEISLRQNFGTAGSATVQLPTQNFNATSGLEIVKKKFAIPSTEGKAFGAGDFVNYQISLPIRSTNPVTLTRFSLVEGDATHEADPFEPRHMQQEWALCQRYYFRTTSAYAASASSSITVPFKVTMRASPTVSATIYGGTYAGAGVTTDAVNFYGLSSTNAYTELVTADAEL